MTLLETAMAFAVTMIIFATVVTGIVEIIARLLAFREIILEQSIEQLYEKVIKKWTGVNDDTKKLSFMSGMLRNPLSLETDGTYTTATPSPSGMGGTMDRLGAAFKELFSGEKRTNNVSALSPLAFVQRLARTSVGEAIVKHGDSNPNPVKGKEDITRVVTDFTRSFDRYGRAASERFRKKTGAWAIGVGVVLAFAMNIDAGRVFMSLNNSAELRASLIDGVDEAVKRNSEAVSQMKAIVDAQAGEGAEETGDTARVAEEMQEKVKAVEGDIAKVRDLGLPIGHEYFPFGDKEFASNTAEAEDRGRPTGFWAYFYWVCLTALAGILIGLGGPFWFRVFSSLSQVFQMLRAVGLGSGKAQKVRSEEVETPEKVEKALVPESLYDAFINAAKVHESSRPGDQQEDTPPAPPPGQPQGAS